MSETWRKIRVPLAGITGAGLGTVTGELTGETVARSVALTGWKKVGIKGAVKGGICALAYGISLKLPGSWSLFAEIFGYGSAGSWFYDVFYQLFPGGIWGMAESMAVSLRTWAVGKDKVKAEIEAAEAGFSEEEVAATAGSPASWL